MPKYTAPHDEGPGSVILALALFLTTLLLSYANGANDNFKGVATLFGSGSTSYRRALVWANLTTFAGTAAAVFLFRALLAWVITLPVAAALAALTYGLVTWVGGVSGA